MDGFSVSKKLQNNYSGYYIEESGWRRIGAMDKVSNIILLCSRYRHDNIIEIGAGEGSILARLSELEFGTQLHALEISQSGVDVIRNRNIENLNEVSVFDGYTVPYSDNKFDLAIMSHVIEHSEFPRRLLYEAGRVAEFVFIEVPLEDTLSLPKNYTFDSVGHINFYSPTTIRRLVQTCELEVVEQIVTNKSRRLYQYHSKFSGFIKYLIKQTALNTLPAVATMLWTYHSAIIARKMEPEE